MTDLASVRLQIQHLPIQVVGQNVQQHNLNIMSSTNMNLKSILILYIWIGKHKEKVKRSHLFRLPVFVIDLVTVYSSTILDFSSNYTTAKWQSCKCS